MIKNIDVAKAVQAARKKRFDEVTVLQESHGDYSRRNEMLRISSQVWIRKCRKAHRRDYEAWLRGWIENGGEVGNFYEYNMPDDFLVAKSSFTVTPLYGAASVSIIVPAGIEVTADDLGHNDVYWMDGFRHGGPFSPPCYADIANRLER